MPTQAHLLKTLQTAKCRGRFENIYWYYVIIMTFHLMVAGWLSQKYHKLLRDSKHSNIGHMHSPVVLIFLYRTKSQKYRTPGNPISSSQLIYNKHVFKPHTDFQISQFINTHSLEDTRFNLIISYK